MSDMERRSFSVTGFRVETRGGKPVIEGHAAVFGQRAEIAGFTEEVAAGAFRDSIGADDIRALFNHDSNFVLGRNRSGTLELREDGRGLFTRIHPPDAQWARDMLVSIERGDITQMSFGFRTIEDAWSQPNGMPHRTLKRVQLFDVSPVTFPAYPQTDVTVAMRRAEQWARTHGGLTIPSIVPGGDWLSEAQARDRQLELQSRRISPRDLGKAESMAAARGRFLDFKCSHPYVGRVELIAASLAAQERGRELQLNRGSR